MKNTREIAVRFALGLVLLAVGLWLGEIAWMVLLLGFMGLANGAQLLMETDAGWQKLLRWSVIAACGVVLTRLLAMLPVFAGYAWVGFAVRLALIGFVAAELHEQAATTLAVNRQRRIRPYLLGSACGVLAVFCVLNGASVGYLLGASFLAALGLLGELLWLFIAYRRIMKKEKS